MIILIIGPQGSGKTTQAKLLAERLQLDFVSMGEALRKLYIQKDPIGLEAEKYWSKGELVPDSVIRRVMERSLVTREMKKGAVIDGFPRNIAQYEWMKDVFDRPIAAVVNLLLDEETIHQRLDKRRQIEHRGDETPRAIATRLKHYQEDTFPLIEKFQKDAVPVITIDGRGSIEDIQAEILARLEELAAP
ncbi:MAG: adenylate kinase family protein [Anaerolineae bacterium]